MSSIVLICRILLGVTFVAFGFNGLHPFMPAGPVPAADSLLGEWMNVMTVSGWGHVISVVELVGGLLVLSGRMVPMGIALLCPITFNILCFHMLVSRPMIQIGLATGVFELVLIYYYRPYFRGITTYMAEPVFSQDE